MPSSTFQILDAADPQQRQRWADLWHAWPQRDIFAHPGYVALYSEAGERTLCAHGDYGTCQVLYPFILRDLTKEEFWLPDVASGSDIISPYGYGGPYKWGEEGDCAGTFWAEFADWAQGFGLVSEFIRFSLFSENLLSYPGEREMMLQNVVRGLDFDAEALFQDFEHKVRKNVKKALRSGVTIERDATGARLDDYLAIYEHTMNRRDAGRRYYFPRSYYETIHRDLPGQFMYFHAVHAGRVISTELVLVSAENVYSFLGGTLEDSFDLRPNDLLKVDIMHWAQEMGKRRFILGGGYKLDDGIFRYKLSFAPNDSIVPFYVGRRVLNPALYQRLIDNKARLRREQGQDWAPAPTFFPAYRA